MNPQLFYKSGASVATHVLYIGLHGRCFILPRNGIAAACGIKFFVTNPFVRLLNRVIQIRGATNYMILNSNLLERLKFGEFDVDRLVVALGSPGPYSKYAILSLDHSYAPQFLTKLATNVGASKLVTKEAEALRYLSTLEGVSGVPELLDCFQGDDCAWARQTVGIGTVWKRLNCRPILTFMKLLASKTEVFCRFENANSYAVLNSRHLNVSHLLSKAWQYRAELAMKRLKLNSTLEMRFVFAHRDLTRWNVKNIFGEPFVYDWEYSEMEYPELYDLLHFFILPDAIKNNLSLSTLNKNVVPVTKIYMGERICDFQWQLLFYLLDLSLFYLESNNGCADGDVVVKRYGNLIDQILSETQ